jgi:hypothetical protein
VTWRSLVALLLVVCLAPARRAAHAAENLETAFKMSMNLAEVWREQNAGNRPFWVDVDVRDLPGYGSRQFTNNQMRDALQRASGVRTWMPAQSVPHELRVPGQTFIFRVFVLSQVHHNDLGKTFEGTGFLRWGVHEHTSHFGNDITGGTSEATELANDAVRTPFLRKTPGWKGGPVHGLDGSFGPPGEPRSAEYWYNLRFGGRVSSMAPPTQPLVPFQTTIASVGGPTEVFIVGPEPAPGMTYTIEVSAFSPMPEPAAAPEMNLSFFRRVGGARVPYVKAGTPILLGVNMLLHLIKGKFDPMVVVGFGTGLVTFTAASATLTGAAWLGGRLISATAAKTAARFMWTRFIPVVGWVLLAADTFLVGCSLYYGVDITWGKIWDAWTGELDKPTSIPPPPAVVDWDKYIE